MDVEELMDVYMFLGHPVFSFNLKKALDWILLNCQCIRIFMINHPTSNKFYIGARIQIWKILQACKQCLRIFLWLNVDIFSRDPKYPQYCLIMDIFIYKLFIFFNKWEDNLSIWTRFVSFVAIMACLRLEIMWTFLTN